MKRRPFKQVDVFTAEPCLGNALAVVLDGTGLDDAQMQRFARWTNLSETTFVLEPTAQARAGGADYRVRIFTPGGELPFAGHPTLGSCHAWIQNGGQPQATDLITQECGVGLVTIRRDGARLAFAAPPLTRSNPEPTMLERISQALGLRPAQIIAAQLLDNGPVWLGLWLDSSDTVLALTPDHAQLKDLEQNVGVAGTYYSQHATSLIARSNREARAFAGHPGTEVITPDMEVRAFAAPLGVDEDPVTGSLNASLAQWLIADGLAPKRYLVAQGTCLERAGRVYIERDASGQVWVGGESVTCVEGTVTL